LTEGLTPGNIYSNKIRAKNEANKYSDFSDIIMVGCGDLPSNLLAPTNDPAKVTATTVVIDRKGILDNLPVRDIF